MTPGRSLRKSDQKGVEAIFSSPKKPRQTGIIVGLLALFTGVSFIVASLIMVLSPHLWDPSTVTLYGPLGFASMGVFLLTCGAGIIISRFQLSHATRSNGTVQGDIPGSLSLTAQLGDPSRLSTPPISGPNLRLVLAVFLQGTILLSLFSGLVDEYQSNPTMQAWVRSSLDYAQYLLNWGALLVSSFLLGILVVYSLVTSDLGE